MSRPPFRIRLLIAGLVVSGCALSPATAIAAPGDVELVSRAFDGSAAVEPYRWSQMGLPRISADGQRVAYSSNAVNLVAEDTRGQTQVYLRDVTKGTTELVSRGDGPDGAPADDQSTGTGGAWVLDISADGRYVLFSAVLDGSYPRIYRRDVETQRTVLVSRADGYDGQRLGGRAGRMTADGTKAVISMGAPSGAPEALPGWTQTYLRDIAHGRTVLVSRRDGVDGAVAVDGHTDPAGISPNGRYVTFLSRGANLLPGTVAVGSGQIFLRDVRYGRTMLVSRADGPLGVPVRDIIYAQAPVTADGCQVAFTATGLAVAPGGPANGGIQSYVRDLCAGRTTLVSRADGPNGAAATSSAFYGTNGVNTQAMSADGRYVAFSTVEANVVPGGGNGAYQTFLRDRVGGRTVRVSGYPGVEGRADDGHSGGPDGVAMSPDARFLAFPSTAALVPGTVDGTTQIYRRDLGVQEPGTPIVACGITDDPGFGDPLVPCRPAPEPEPPTPPVTPTPVEVPLTEEPPRGARSPRAPEVPFSSPLPPVLSVPTLVRAPAISDVRVSRRQVSLWVDLPATVRVQVQQQRTVVRRVGKRRVPSRVWRLARTVDRPVKRGGRVRVALPPLRRGRYRIDVRAYGTSTTVSPRESRTLDLRTTKGRR